MYVHTDSLSSVPKALCCGPSPWSLVPKPIPVLRPGQPTKHQLNHADPDLRLAGISQVFIILAVNPAPTQPAEGSLHHPPPRQQLKPSVPGKPADDLNHIPPVLRDPSVQGVIVVLGVRPQLPQARKRFAVNWPRTFGAAAASSTAALVTATARSNPMVSTEI